jgi:hypothetical protein
MGGSFSYRKNKRPFSKNLYEEVLANRSIGIVPAIAMNVWLHSAAITENPPFLPPLSDHSRSSGFGYLPPDGTDEMKPCYDLPHAYPVNTG